jgi:hypothetical protein
MVQQGMVRRDSEFRMLGFIGGPVELVIGSVCLIIQVAVKTLVNRERQIGHRLGLSPQRLVAWLNDPEILVHLFIDP